MGKAKITSYKGAMNRSAAFRRAIAAIGEPARALLFVSALSCLGACNDGDSGPPGSGAGAPSSGAGGGAGATAGEGGSPDGAAGEAGSTEPMAGQGGNPIGGSTGGPGGAANGGRAGGPNPDALCFSDSDCDDGLFCNGVELCKSLLPGSDAKVCMGPEQPPCGPSACNEATRCDCSHPDQDGDGFLIGPCTTAQYFDCDDTDANRKPGNAEVCDAAQHDEDCRDESYGAKDADDDGAFDQSCANKSFYQPLYFTPSKPLIASGSDCDDDNRFVRPGAVEVCDNLDNNCNGQIDDVTSGQGDPHTYYRDADADQYGTDVNPLDTLCNSPPPGYALLKGDCIDTDGRVNPGREEICDGVDNDCSGTVDQPDKPGNLIVGQPYDGGNTEYECTGVPGWIVKKCPAGRLDCDQNYLDACETIATTLCNCHACGKTCSFACGETDCEEIRTLVTGHTHTCATMTGGKVTCWGRNERGQLGDGSTKAALTPVLVEDLTGATAIAAGESHSCAIAAIASTAGIYCWGDNKFNQMGAQSQLPLSVHPLLVPSPVGWGKPTALASGFSHNCAIYGQGLLACWGSNEAGQLGDGFEGEGKSSAAPGQVIHQIGGAGILNAKQVVAGDSHTCVLAAGKVECWGANDFGQLGEDPDNVTSRPLPRPVPGLDAIVVDELAAGPAFTCARSGTDVYCWGSNSFGELAQSQGMFGTPTKIPLPSNIVSITAGRYLGCARSQDGTARCWGTIDSDTAVPGQDPPGAPPTLIALQNITGIFAGAGAHFCAQTNGSKNWCWGKNDFGQLGSNTISKMQSVPTPVSALVTGPSCSL
jgi:alpha-tubulin suppressor-like RCC1 family protein